jgi:hypothetical protein
MQFLYDQALDPCNQSVCEEKLTFHQGDMHIHSISYVFLLQAPLIDLSCSLCSMLLF